jgi:hypothetical protein
MKLTPLEKAEQLIDNVGVLIALFIVNEIIDALETYDNFTEQYLKDEFGIEYFSAELQNMDSDFRYWNKVKQVVTKQQKQ